MDYIILDLEWDSMYFPKEKRFINQILQIGAVRLDGEFNTVGTYSATVRSEISNRVSSRFAKLTGITSEIMRAGISFCEAVEGYNRFAEGAEVTMTWSNSDLYTIIENEEHLLKDGVKFNFKGYLDLQKLVQAELVNHGYESKNQIALESAAELLRVDTESFELHTALDDCLVCAELFRLCYNKQRFDSLLKDTTAPDFYARLKFKPYAISDIHDRNINRSELVFLCPECGGKTDKMGVWKYRNRWFIADFKCRQCRFKFSGRVAFKKTYDDIQVKHRVCEYRPKKRDSNDMRSVSETVQGAKDGK